MGRMEILEVRQGDGVEPSISDSRELNLGNPGTGRNWLEHMMGYEHWCAQFSCLREHTRPCTGNTAVCVASSAQPITHSNRGAEAQRQRNSFSSRCVRCTLVKCSVVVRKGRRKMFTTQGCLPHFSSTFLHHLANLVYILYTYCRLLRHRS